MQPNLLFIQTDQLTVNVLGAYGYPICRTPHLDDITEKGILFERAYCNFPLCAPSRFSMATGLLASKIGAYDNAAELPASVPTYAHYMRALGYQTCLSGKMHFVGPDQLHGFETRLTTDIYPSNFAWSADWTASGFDGATDIRMLTTSGVCARSVQLDYDEEVSHQAIKHLYDIARSDDPRPFFMQVSFTHPHDPYLCLQTHWDRYDGVEIPPPAVNYVAPSENDPHSIRVMRQHGLLDADISDEVIERARRAYCGTVSYIDDHVGRLMDAVRECGLSDRTVIVFCSDHGEMLGERGLWLKKTFFEPALRVPLIIYDPRAGSQGRRVRTLCSLLDLLPTFIGFGSDGGSDAIIEPLDGCDLNRLDDDEERTVLAELLCEGIPAPTFMIRRDRYKFITNGVDPDMLFDLETDPLERVNLAADDAHAGVVSNFRSTANSHWNTEELTKDILLSQRRRLLIRKSHNNGQPPNWDFMPIVDDKRWYRGDGNYNDWAFAHLPQPKKQ